MLSFGTFLYNFYNCFCLVVSILSLFHFNALATQKRSYHKIQTFLLKNKLEENFELVKIYFFNLGFSVGAFGALATILMFLNPIKYAIQHVTSAGTIIR